VGTHWELGEHVEKVIGGSILAGTPKSKNKGTRHLTSLPPAWSLLRCMLNSLVVVCNAKIMIR